MPAVTSAEVHDLLSAARKGDATALGQLLQAYRPLLLALAHDLMAASLRAKAGCSDLVQDTCVEAVTGFKGFQGHSPVAFRHWLERILRHNVSDFSRHFCDTGKRQASRERPLHRSDLLPAEGSLSPQLASPVGRLLQQERAEALQKGLARLSEEDRQVLLLRQRDHLPFDEVARQLGCTPAAARQRWARALGRWRRTLESSDGSP